MAQTKAELLKQAKELGLELDSKLKVAEIASAIEAAQVTPVASEEPAAEVEEKSVAKAGKRSAKAAAEVEEKEAKEARKAGADTEAEKPKAKPQKVRTRLERRGKNFRKVNEQIEAGKLYKVAAALELATKTNPVKFDATVEMHFRLNVDPRQADQNIRDTIVLPAGTGNSVRVAVYADVDDVAKAKKAGADVAGAEEFLQQLDKGVIDFDVLIATPAGMPKLGKYARVLGPKGLMPNPKSGTVSTDVVKAVQEAKAGKVEYRVDSTGIVHLGIGKVSFGADKLNQNAQAVIASLKNNKPNTLKQSYIRSVFVTTSMGPSINVDIVDVNN